jgi:uncharacterized protein
VTRAGEGTLVPAPHAVADARTAQQGVPTLVAAATVAGAAGLAVLGQAAGAGDVAEIETFVLIFASIVIEALPFILLGALVSAAIGVYVPDGVFDHIGRLPLGLQVPGAALGGLAFPVCECGSVPVARRLIVRGVHPAAGIAFMLASPVINPIVLVSTWVAYDGRGNALEMVLGRMVLGLFLAGLAGILIGRLGPSGLLRPRASESGHSHAHGHGQGASRREAYVEHLASDFLFMGKFIVLGAALAAAMQTLIPQSIVSGIAGSTLIAPLALMGLAYMLSPSRTSRSARSSPSWSSGRCSTPSSRCSTGRRSRGRSRSGCS